MKRQQNKVSRPRTSRSATRVRSVVERAEAPVDVSLVDYMERLGDNQRVFRVLADGANEPILVALRSGRHLYANAAAAELTGFSIRELLSTNATDLVAEHDRTRVQALTQARLAGRPIAETYEVTLLHKNGREIPVEVIGSRMSWGRHAVTVGMVRNISERRALEREILEICTREQYRIGRDLHDTLGQELAGMSFLAKAMRKRLAVLSPDLAKEIVRLEEWINDALIQTRRISRGLSPVDNSPGGLAMALRHLAAMARDVFGVKCWCLIKETALVYDHNVATHLYHIAQEALNNAVRHGGPSRVQIVLSTGKRNRLVVRNDGQPLPEKVDEALGLGIRIMRYRTRMCDGSFSLQRSTNGKTVLAVTFENPGP